MQAVRCAACGGRGWKVKIPTPTKGWHVDVAGVALAVFIAASAYLLLVAPVHRQRERDQMLGAEGSTREQRARELDAELWRASQELKELTKLNTETNLRVENDTRLNQRIAALSDLASGAGLAVDVIEPGVGRPGVLYHVTPIQVAGRARYSQVRAFMAALHRGMPDVPVTSLSLSAAPSTVESPIYFTIELLWHTSAAPASTSPKPQLTNGN